MNMGGHERTKSGGENMGAGRAIFIVCSQCDLAAAGSIRKELEEDGFPCRTGEGDSGNESRG